MRIGDKTDRVQLQRPTATQDAYGDESRGWVTVATLLGRVVPLEGEEFIQAQQVAGAVSHRIEIWRENSVKAVTPSWRLRVSKKDSPETWRDFDILAPLHVSTRELHLMAKERV